MDITQLQTFVRVSQYGSFTKAGEQSFISGTAVMKQINRLESELNLKLFVRTATGTKLTAEGEKFLPYVNQILSLLDTAIEETRKAGLSGQNIINVGTSILHPADPFMEIWKKITAQMPDYQIRIVQLQEDLRSKNREYAMLGKNCDIIVGTFDNTTLKQSFDAITLGQYDFGIAVRSDNPLAKLSQISFEDLDNQELLSVPMGISEKNDQLRKIIHDKYPTIKIVETTGRYDMNTFNQAVEENIPLITLTPWKRIHPNLVSIPLETDIHVSYGILTTKFPGSKVDDFLLKLSKVLKS
ncbi:LysR family transcriptional regulator [Companilactobacillus pabuli]|jgi:DNA-binding transcriptional LysR family regulator|uniref:LysR family transcriptional regulator n=1 Tax=Companilactobacillus pabuli TaxID=2714036 RepID=A0A7L7KWD5_9LACO|nr:LysR family transcriptional regulator [Companilactobacillus pabuli]AKP03916.1 LysR family transcriptional regulator [Companilactobacillus farciminis]AKS52221.1 LysR family transcriptional regulator [Companilactobacillus farciminis]MDG5113160.1 LysR family transcriptional regulator [Companilactobacillus pabuli]QMT84025.1 LysR family transcriptional regulator [Companilactobacillus pabuli]GAQ00246.1 LysR family transcriptional regulator [Companilactobacillus farciminis]